MRRPTHRPPPMSASSPSRADYGIDAPGVVRNFFLIAAAALLAGFALYSVLEVHQYQLARSLRRTGIITAFWCGGTGLVMLWGSRVGKLRLRDKLLDRFGLRGDERVLDVGCGRGLMLIGVAKRLRAGRVVGLDLWQTRDQSGNALDTTLDNVRAEGVADRVQIQTGDMQEMPFPDATFDAVVSSWAIHNVPTAEGRRKAITEIVRVLKPGGRVLLVDIQQSAAYVETLRALGMEDVRREGPNFLFVIPSYTVTARKKAA